MKKQILIFIITYKASFRLEKVFRKIPFNRLKKFNTKVFISDDNSQDDTINFAYKIFKKVNKNVILNFNKRNLNYGGNIKLCLRYAIRNNYDYALMLHGDNQYNPKYLFKMIREIEKNNTTAVCGSRMINKMDALKGKMPLYKFLGNIILTKIFNLLFRTRFTDCHSGFWLYKLSSLKKLNLNNITNSFNFDNQLRIAILKNEDNILEIPIKTYYGDERSSIHFFYAIKFLYEIFFFKYFKSK
jgi:hypothetical protein